MLCIRNDNESAFTGESLSAFMRTISSAFTNCISVDTHIGRDQLSIRIGRPSFSTYEVFQEGTSCDHR